MSTGIVSAQQIAAQINPGSILHDQSPKDGNALVPGEVAEIFRVDPKTVTRYIMANKFPEGGVFVTLGGHHRIFRWAVRAAIEASSDATRHEDSDAVIEAGIKAFAIKHKERTAKARADLAAKKARESGE